MQDRVPLYPGRVKMTPVAGQANTFDMVRADDPTQAGTPLNKATLLKDATAALYGLGTGAVPDDVLAELGKSKQYWRPRTPPAGDREYPQYTDRSAYPDSGTQDGYEYEYLGIPFDNAVTAPKIATGSYVGNGAYGSANPNRLTFGFAPQLVILPHVDDYNGCPEHVMFYAGTRNYKIANGITGTLEGRELSWYSTSSASEQFNVSGRTYHYVAIG